MPSDENHAWERLTMIQPGRLPRVFRSGRGWIALSVVAPLGMLVVCGMMLLDLRRDAWDKAEQTSRNLLQLFERDIARNVEVLDLSLQGVVENLHDPEAAGVSPRLRQRILFDRSASARDLGVLLVINETGEVEVDAAAVPPRKGNYADREYFRAHKNNPGLGLYVGRPLVSRLTGERMLPFSRRISRPDGSFGGVVLGSLKLSYFTGLFDRIGLGLDGAINLYLRDGTRIVRHPYVEADVGTSVAGTVNFDRILQQGAGAFIGKSVRDGVERHFAFSPVNNLPLIVTVSVSTRETEAQWRAEAAGIGFVVLVLCGMTVALSLLFARELRHRETMHAEMARLSETDALTGLPNRRRFEHALALAADDARRTGKPLSLLVVDADYFKRFNDRYGHAVGDEVLRGLARCLSASVHRPGDLACRVGGEEFVLLLEGTDEPGALRVAEEVHAQVSRLAVAAAGIGAGAVTVSVGLATGNAEVGGLYDRADAALYEAKAGGRNQTRCAPASKREWAGERGLRLVGT